MTDVGGWCSASTPGARRAARWQRRIEERVGDRLEVRSLHDPQVEHWRRHALGENAAWGPTLIEIKGTKVEAWTGSRMGIALGNRLGPTATWRIMQALGEESAISKAKGSPADAIGGISRGQFLKGLAGGLVAVSVLPAGQALAASQEATGIYGVARVPARSVTLSRLKRFRAVSNMYTGFGSPDWSEVIRAKYKENGEERTLFVIPYRSSPASAAAGTTFLIADDEASVRDAQSIALRPHQTGKDQGKLDYYLADGSPLATIEVRDGKAEAQPSGDEVALNRCRAARACPRPGFVGCFIYCIGRAVDASCAVPPPGPAPCIQCVACAGFAGRRCARLCSRVL
jgi:hypothetical protein